MMTLLIAWCAFIIGFFVGLFWAGRRDDDEMRLAELRRQNHALRESMADMQMETYK